MEKRLLITPIRRFFNLLKVDKKDIGSLYVYALFNGIVTLSIPLGIQAIISFITAGEVSSSWIVLVVFVILGVAFTGIMQIMQLTITENLQQKIFTRSAFEFAYRIPRMKRESIDRFYMPEMVNRFFDTLTVQKGLPKILMDFSGATLQIIFGLILLSLYHPFFIMFSLVLILIVFLIFRFTAPRGLKTSLQESERKYEVAHWLEELARANSTFKLAGKTNLPLEKTDHKVKDYLGFRKAHFKTLVLQYINLVGFKMVIAAGLLLIGGLLVINQQMNIGQFVASEIIIILVLASVEKLILSMETIYDVLTAIEKVGTISDIPLEEDNGIPLELKDGEGLSVEVKDFSFQFEHEKKPILSDINFNVPASGNLCVAGFNGSGKSMMLQMISGLYESYSGSMSFNKLPISAISREALRYHTGDSTSKEDIFYGTIHENITLGKEDISLGQIQEIVELLDLTDFVASVDNGYETHLLPEGKNLPRSIRLKIMLARAIVGSPKLVLLEDSFAELRKEVKERFLEYVLHPERNWTVILISNDPDVAKRFDQVLVLEKGKEIGYDTLENLSKKPWYNQLFHKL